MFNLNEMDIIESVYNSLLSIGWQGPVFFGIPIYLYYKYYFYPRHIGPLRHIPGPNEMLSTSLCSIYEQLTGNPGEYIKQLHRQYGPIIHAGMGIISVADPEGVKSIYSGYKNLKDPSIEVFRENVPNIFSTTDPHYHSMRKKMMAPIFNQKNMKLMESELSQMGYKSLAYRLYQMYADGDTSVDMYSMFLRTTLDVISHLILGNCIDSVNNDNIDPTTLTEPIKNTWAAKFLFPFLFFLKPKHHPLLKETIVNSIEARKTGARHPDILQQLLDAENGDTGKKFNETEVIEEGITLLFAGMDTTGLTMVWALYHLLQRPEIYTKLVNELITKFPDIEQDITYEESKECSYLRAVIWENIRYMPVAATFSTRITPESGITLMGHYIPPKTLIGTHIYTYHRYPPLWDHPDEFLPERWIQAQNDGTERKLQSQILSFGGGVRGCLGKELAWMEMYVTLANLIRKFDFKLLPDTILTPHDTFVVKAKEEKFVVGFEPRIK